MCCRIKEKLHTGQLQVMGDQWPVFLYANFAYDLEDPWNGLLHSGQLVLVSLLFFLHSKSVIGLLTNHTYAGIQAYIHFSEFH